jgi:hypothetical protein
VSNLVPYDPDKDLPVKRGEIIEAEFQEGRWLVHGWRWRDRNGRWFYPKDMETRHVFHTIKMIWNNFMPAHMAFRDARHYYFGPTYTMQYLKEALINLWPELEKRNNLTGEMIRQIEIMRRWIQGMAKDGGTYLFREPPALPKPED